MIQTYQRYFAILIAISILCVDAAVPLGVAVGTLYMIPIYQFVKKSIILRLTSYWFCVFCSILIVAGYYISPVDGIHWEVIVNRLLSIFIIWISYLFFVDFFRAKQELIKKNNELINLNLSLNEITDNAPLIIKKTKLDGELLFINKAISKNVELENLIGTSIYDYLPESQHQICKEKIREALDYNETTSYTVRISKIEGGEAYVTTSVTPLFFESKETQLLLITEDVTQQKLLEEQIKNSLKEKEVLLSEIHHRVKNNLQVIWGLLDLQQRRTANKEVKALLNDSKNRVNSISLIHQSLYRNENFSKISLDDYINELVKNVKDVDNHHFIEYEVKVEGVELSIETGIPLGLIINEVIANSLKHAFMGRSHGTISITVEKMEQIEVIIKDDGVGFDEQTLTNNDKGLGMKLIHNLAKQIDAEIKIASIPSKGTTYQISFYEE